MFPFAERILRYPQRNLGFAVCYSLLVFSCTYGEEWLKKRMRCRSPRNISKEWTFLTIVASVYVFFRRGML